MIVAGIIAWWLVGFATMVWLLRSIENITWGEFAFISTMACGGPIVFAVIGLLVLIDAKFWQKPVLWWKKGEPI